MKKNDQIKMGVAIYPLLLCLLIGWVMINLVSIINSYWIIGVGLLIMLPLLILQVWMFRHPFPMEEDLNYHNSKDN